MAKNFKHAKTLFMCIFMSFIMILGASVTSYAAPTDELKNEGRFSVYATASMIIEREYNGERQILLQLRQNTGYMDNMWDLGAGGHLDEGETMRQAAIRESKEELNIDVAEEDMEFVYLGSNFIPNKGIYNCTYFKVNKFSGDLKANEPKRCREIRWFKLNDLPDNLIPMHRDTLNNYLNGKYYSEFGWEDYRK